MANDEINFMDLACILKITPDTVLEKFGSQINASFFDASNIAGTLKQKGLIDFTANYPGPNGIVLTDAGKNLINEANAKSAEPFDDLDKSILVQLSGGKRNPAELGVSLNIRPKDLALRLYKLSKQEYITYELKNGNVEIMLTEKGFLAIPKAQGAQQANVQATHEQNSQEANIPPDHGLENQAIKSKPKMSKKVNLILLAILIIIVLVFILYYKNII
jgi:predicted transcriptional regulator